jgi:uncharacterized protein involved in outer membrane biogenesis
VNKVLTSALAAGALLAALVFLVPPFVDFGRYQSSYLPLIEEALGRKVKVGEVRLRVVPRPSIRVTEVSVSGPANTQEPFARAQALSLRMKLWPLLRGRVEIDQLIIERPSVRLEPRPGGGLGLPTAGRGKTRRGENATARPFPALIPSRLRIERGELTISRPGKKALHLTNVELSLDGFLSGRPFPYRLGVDLPGANSVGFAGEANYDPSRARLALERGELKLARVLFAVTGSLNDLMNNPVADVKIASQEFDGRAVLDLLAAGGLRPKMEMAGPMGAEVSLRGPLTALRVGIDADLRGLKLDFPAALRGTLYGKSALGLDLAAGQPISSALRGNGRFELEDGMLTRVDLLPKIEMATGLAGLSSEERAKATTFESLTGEFSVEHGAAALKNLLLLSPLLEAKGGGTLRIDAGPPSLDLRVSAAVAPEISARAGRGKLVGLLKDDQGRIVVPLRIRGPLHSPSVSPETTQILRRGADQFLRDLFGRK